MYRCCLDLIFSEEELQRAKKNIITAFKVIVWESFLFIMK